MARPSTKKTILQPGELTLDMSAMETVERLPVELLFGIAGKLK